MPNPKSLFLTYAGETLHVADWARRTGIPAGTIVSRVTKQGWPSDRALTTPVDRRFRRGGRRAKDRPRPVPRLEPTSDGRAIARWSDGGVRRAVYFGAWGSEAAAGYRRFAAEWAAAGGPRTAAADRGGKVFVSEVVEACLAWAAGYFRKDGIPTRTVHAYRSALLLLNDLYGETAAAEFGPTELRAVQAALEAKGLVRKACNEYTGIVARASSWPAGREMVPAAVADQLRHAERLAAGRTAAPDRPRIPAVPAAAVELTVPYLHALPARAAVPAAMVRVQFLARMRPGELTAMAAGCVDRSATPWRYEVAATNKNRHKGRPRVVFFGPAARAILGPWLDSAQAPESPVWVFPPRGTKRPLGVRVTREAFCRFVTAAATAAGVPVWRPGQLRKAGATAVQRAYEGDEKTAAALGNTPEVARQVYTDSPGEAAAKRIAEETG